MPRQLTIEEIAQRFGKAHVEEAEAKIRRESYRKQFFSKIIFKDEDLARQVIYYTGSDPEGYIAAIYPKWRIVTKQWAPESHPGDVDEDTPGEWKIIIEENPEFKKFTLVNPLDGQVYERTVSESAPQVDLERLKHDDNTLWLNITVQPKPPRELKSLEELTDDQKEALQAYLLPPKLTPTMQKPRKPKDEELENLHGK